MGLVVLLAMIKQKLSPADFDVEYNPSETLSLIIGSALLRISIKAPAKPKLLYIELNNVNWC